MQWPGLSTMQSNSGASLSPSRPTGRMGSPTAIVAWGAVPDGCRVHHVRRGCESGEWVPMGRGEYWTAGRRLRIGNAPEWVDA